MRLLSAIARVAALTLPLVTCDTRATESVATGETRVLLTDAPFPYYRVARVDLFIVSVAASLSPDTSAAVGSGSSFVTVATPNRRINLLALQNGLTDQLGAVRLPTGAVTAVRVVINTDSSSITLRSGAVLTGSSRPGIAWQSSAGRPTLDALVHEQIVLPDTGAIIAIDFDVGKAFLTPQDLDPTSTDSGFVFSPVLRAASAARTGSISGVVHSTNGSVQPDVSLRLYLGNPAQPENTWSNLQTARTDAQGTFKFSYVTRSSHWASIPAQAGKTYIVAADPPPGLGLGRSMVPNLTVVAGGETKLSMILP